MGGWGSDIKYQILVQISDIKYQIWGQNKQLQTFSKDPAMPSKNFNPFILPSMNSLPQYWKLQNKTKTLFFLYQVKVRRLMGNGATWSKIENWLNSEKTTSHLRSKE